MKKLIKYSPLILMLCIGSIVLQLSCTHENDMADDNKSLKPIAFSIQTLDDSNTGTKSAVTRLISRDRNEQVEVEFYETPREPELVPATKTTWNLTGNSNAWSVGDSVGIYMRRTNRTPDITIDRNNLLYTATTASTTSSLVPNVIPILYYPASPNDTFNLYAYYPYNNFGITTQSPISFPTAASVDNDTLIYSLPENQNSISDCDVMYARRASLTRNTASPISLTFNHAMVMMTFRIRSTNHAGEMLTKIQLTGSKMGGTGTIYLDNASVVQNGSPNFSPYFTTNQALNATNFITLNLFINPCSIGSNTNNTEMQLTMTVNGADYSTNITRNKGLSRGTRYTTNITIL